MKQNVRGFTLMELMITVAIVAILAAIAVPNYSDYVRKSRRNEAMQALNATRNALEKFRLSENAYPVSISDLNDTITSHGLTQNGTIWQSENGFYEIRLLVDVSGNPVAVFALAQGSQLQDQDCRRFWLFMTGVRQARDATNTSWTTTTCWAN